MKKNKTIYAHIVSLKKGVCKKQIIPDSIGKYIDNFFNTLHNVIFMALRHVKYFLKNINDLFTTSVLVTNELTKKSLRKKNKKGLKNIINHTARLWFPFRFLQIFFSAVFLLVGLRGYWITKKSDKRAVRNIDKIIVNSINIENRVKKYYNQSSIVINPPIATSKLKHKKSKGYWLSVNRIFPEKRIEIQIKAFQKLPREKLFVVGGYDAGHLDYINKLKKIAPKNVVFLGNVDETKLLDFYSKCKGFITTAIDEDFGMTPVEAMASGKPVIAPNEGGYKETVIHKKTGILIDDMTAQKLADKIMEIKKRLNKNPTLYKKECINRAKQFDEKVFIKKMKYQIGL